MPLALAIRDRTLGLVCIERKRERELRYGGLHKGLVLRTRHTLLEEVAGKVVPGRVHIEGEGVGVALHPRARIMTGQRRCSQGWIIHNALARLEGGNSNGAVERALEHGTEHHLHESHRGSFHRMSRCMIASIDFLIKVLIE